MAYAKCAMDAGAKVNAGSIVTAMTRNGREFGIRVSGLGARWFTAPVDTPAGLFFNGYTAEDASPDIGDSAITECLGIGGAAMIAAPGVTRFVGAGGYSEALEISEEMREIYIDTNPMFPIPNWNFQGACLGLDVRRVVGNRHYAGDQHRHRPRTAGIGQIGAGTVRAPLSASSRRSGAAVDMGVRMSVWRIASCATAMIEPNGPGSSGGGGAPVSNRSSRSCSCSRHSRPVAAARRRSVRAPRAQVITIVPLLLILGLLFMQVNMLVAAWPVASWR
jgi:hypothetical protein